MIRVPVSNHIFRRNAVYYWRKRLPAPLARRLGRTALTRTLRTACHVEARRLARELSAEAEHLFRLIMFHLDGLTDTQLELLLEQFLNERIQHRENKLPNPLLMTPEQRNHSMSQLQAELAAIQSDQRPLDRTEPLLQKYLRSKLVGWNVESHVYNGMLQECLQLLIKELQWDLTRHLQACSLSTNGVGAVPFPVTSPTHAPALSLPATGAQGAVAASLLADRGPPSAPPVAPPPDPPGKKVRSISLVFENYAAEKITEGSWTPKTHDQSRASFLLFLNLHGDRPPSAYIRTDAVEFKRMLMTLPADYGQAAAYRGLTFREIIERAEGRDGPKISAKTVNRHLAVFTALWKWFETHDEATANIFTGLLLKKSKKKMASEERFRFGTETLRTLFSSPVWTGCKSEKKRAKPGNLIIKDSKYWVPLLGAYAGMRLEEASQLRIRDIESRDGIDVFLIRDFEGQRVKSPDGYRCVPIHRVLIKLGFLEHVRKPGAKPGDLVFPDLRARGKYKSYGVTISRWFTRYRRQIGIYEPRKDFHSLRHDFDTTLQNAKVNDRIVVALMGHASEGETNVRYFKGFEVAVLKDAIEQLTYGLDLETS